MPVLEIGPQDGIYYEYHALKRSNTATLKVLYKFTVLFSINRIISVTTKGGHRNDRRGQKR